MLAAAAAAAGCCHYYYYVLLLRLHEVVCLSGPSKSDRGVSVRAFAEAAQQRARDVSGREVQIKGAMTGDAECVLGPR